MAEWIEEWFGSKYYDILYRHRDEKEAKLFIDNLIPFIRIYSGNVLDCGCGKGRHAIYLAEKGYGVTGVDICGRSILEAKQSEKKNLSFFTHDLRNLFRINYYDLALSLFTSFGYFENESDNRKMTRTISSSLKKGGFLVLDFMNSQREIRHLVPESACTKDKVEFTVRRRVQDNMIVKTIEVDDGGNKFRYTEKVRAYTGTELTELFEASGLKIVHLLGDYDLNPFDELQSERLILVGKKI